MPKLVALLFLISVLPTSDGFQSWAGQPKFKTLKSTRQDDAPPTPIITGCTLKRRPSGVFDLTISGSNIFAGATVSLNGVAPKKVKLKDPLPGEPQVFTRIVVKGRVCKGIPGMIEVRNPGVRGGLGLFFCAETCSD